LPQDRGPGARAGPSLFNVPRMPVYVIADVRDAWDADALQEYRRRNTDAVAAAGGRFLIRGGDHELLEGEWDTKRIVLMEFPDREAVRAWWTSDEYEAIKPLRRGASTTNILLVDGA
jgi:uncharacterized protein (DUF1330 family)